jgi:AcrR family transcriptional regulator
MRTVTGSPDRSQRRVELLDAADRVIRREGPGASMTAIAAEAGITKPILYRHFGDKGGMYQALADRYIEPLVAAVRSVMSEGDDPVARVRATIDAYLGFIEQNRPVYRFLMQRAQREDPVAGTAVATTIRRLGGEVGDALGRTWGLDDEPARARTLGHAIVGMVHVAGDWWLSDASLSRAELADHLTDLVLHGLPTPPGGR